MLLRCDTALGATTDWPWGRADRGNEQSSKGERTIQVTIHQTHRLHISHTVTLPSPVPHKPWSPNLLNRNARPARLADKAVPHSSTRSAHLHLLMISGSDKPLGPQSLVPSPCLFFFFSSMSCRGRSRQKRASHMGLKVFFSLWCSFSWHPPTAPRLRNLCCMCPLAAQRSPSGQRTRLT